VWIRSRTDAKDFTIRRDLTVADPPSRTATLRSTEERTSTVESLLNRRVETALDKKLETKSRKPARTAKFDITDPDLCEPSAYDWIDSMFNKVPDEYLALAVTWAVDEVLREYELKNEYDDELLTFISTTLDTACSGGTGDGWCDLFIGCLRDHAENYCADAHGVLNAIQSHLFGTELIELGHEIGEAASIAEKTVTNEARLETEERLATRTFESPF
jgi:hypothetical protein